MLGFNRELALARYSGSAEPEPPLLRTATGIEKRYSPVTGECVSPSMEDLQIGNGPDEFGYFADTGNSPFPVGTLYNHPATGGVFCAVDRPDPAGGFARAWIRIT